MCAAAPYDIVYLSPHLDDAVLSCGGQIAQSARCGGRVLIATICAGAVVEELRSAAAVEFGLRCGTGRNPVPARREEDMRAASLLGADVLHGPFVDALYTFDPATGQPLYPTMHALRGAVHPLHREQLPALVGWLGELPRYQRMIVPMALGRHVDHRLARVAAERAAGSRLAYYEDFPYAQRWYYRCGWTRLLWGWRPETTRLAPEDVQAKITAAAAYSSQVRTIFGTEETLGFQIRRYVRRVGGERTWRRN